LGEASTPEIITSLSNPKIKQIRALKNRKERDESGLFFIEGIRIVGEASQTAAEINTLVVAPELLHSTFAEDTVRSLEGKGVPCLRVNGEVFASISSKGGPQGIAAVVHQRYLPLQNIAPADMPFWVAMDQIQDPGNLGTILRTSDSVGASGVILIGNCTDPYDPAAVRGSMGAVFAQRLVRCTFDEFRQWKQHNGFTVIGTSGGASHHYRSYKYRQPLVLLMGSEREGLSSDQQEACDAMVSIPMVGRSDSLNLAMATGVVLYEIFEQLHPHPEYWG
jgi:TrmH family RNA methyltransferase